MHHEPKPTCHKTDSAVENLIRVLSGICKRSSDGQTKYHKVAVNRMSGDSSGSSVIYDLTRRLEAQLTSVVLSKRPQLEGGVPVVLALIEAIPHKIQAILHSFF